MEKNKAKIAHNKENKGSTLLGNLVTGAAVIGAGVVAAKVLSNEKSRNAVGNAVKEVGERGRDLIENVRERFAESFDKLKIEYEDLSKTIEHKVKDAKDSKQARDLQESAQALKQSFTDFKDDGSEKAKKGFENLKAKVTELRKDLESGQEK